jgi:hypothetical protein
MLQETKKALSRLWPDYCGLTGLEQEFLFKTLEHSANKKIAEPPQGVRE